MYTIPEFKQYIKYIPNHPDSISLGIVDRATAIEFDKQYEKKIMDYLRKTVINDWCAKDKLNEKKYGSSHDNVTYPKGIERYKEWIKKKYKPLGCPIIQLEGHIEFIDNLSKDAFNFFHLANDNSKSDWRLHIVVVIANTILKSCSETEYLDKLAKWNNDEAIINNTDNDQEDINRTRDLRELGF